MTTLKSGKPIDVLFVEDNEGDVMLVRDALRSANGRLKLHVVGDGEAALEFVRRQKPRPQLIILDMNLPRKSGVDVLDELKADRQFREIPVVIFSSSRSSADVRRAYHSHANSYVHKPADLDEYFAAVAGLERYWTTTALLPAAG